MAPSQHGTTPSQTQPGSLGPAFATGKCIIPKPSEYSRLAALYLAKLFKDAGYPTEVVKVLNGHGSRLGEVLTTHHDIDKIGLPGSSAAGRQVIKACAVNMKNTSIEAGDKSAFIVIDDTDLEQAAKWEAALARGLSNSGQIGSANIRILVQEGAEKKFLKLLSNIARAIKVGQPCKEDTTQGPQVSKMQYERVLGYIEDATREGAKLLIGGKRPASIGSKGFFIQSTIFTGVNNTVRIFHEGIFGLVTALTTFKAEGEAIALADDSTYGLAAMVLTNDLRIAHPTASRSRVQSGMVWANESNNMD